VREFSNEFALEQLTPSLQACIIGVTLYPAPANYYCIQIDAEERNIERWIAVDAKKQ